VALLLCSAGEKMNICIFAKGLPVHITGGMEIHIEGLVDGLIKRGHNVTIMTAPHPKGIEKEEKQNLRIHYLKNKPKYTREKFYRESAKLFGKLNKRENFDVIHSQSTLACGYAKYSKKTAPLILTSHGTALNEIKTILEGRSSIKSFLEIPIWLKIRLLDEPIILKRADRVIAVSNELGEDIKKQYKVSEEKLVVIPNGIDINRFKAMSVDDLREKWDLTHEKLIMSVGAINKQKGFHLLLKILPNILKEDKNIKLFIVGTGPYLQDLKDMSMKLNISDNVIFTGRVSEEDLPKYYNLADVFSFPTLRMEGLPLVVPEAMACEKTVIASRIGGVPTVIENNRDGILVEPGDLKELKERILEVLSDEELAKMFGKNARKKVVEKFSLDRMVEDTIKVYEVVLER
jgi:glycosyltransferase involved in cell wall biosynthesis